MAALPWIKVAVVLPGHPKLQMLEKLLDVEDGLGMLVRLWCWAATYYPEGEFPESATVGMERVVAAELTVTYGRVPGLVAGGGPPRPGEVTDALVTAGWLDPLGGPGGEVERYRVHDWDEFQSAHADKAEREREQVRERVKRFRNRKRNATATVSGSVTPSVTGNAVTAEREKEREKEKETENNPSPRSPVSVLPLGAGSGERTKLGPLGSELRRRVEAGIGHGLGPCTQARADDLERFIQAHGGLEPAYAFVAATYRTGKSEPRTVGWLAEVLAPAAGVAQ